MTLAQTHITNNFIGKNKAKWEVEGSVTTVIVPGDATKIADKLTGPLVIEGDNIVEEIELEGHDIAEITIVNCPNLKKINCGDNKLTKLEITRIKTHDDTNAGSPAPCNNLTELIIGNNRNLREVSLEYCPNLAELVAPDCTNLTKTPGLDKLKKLRNLLFPEGLFNAVMSRKWGGIVDVIKEVAGMGPNENFPDDGSGGIKKDELKNKIESAINSQVPSLKTAKESVEKERDAAKSELESVKNERDQLKQQLAGIIKQLGLASGVTDKQIKAKITELMNRPTGPSSPTCSHTDYDSIKSERDRLSAENTRLKSENEKLKNTKRVLTDVTNLEKLGIKFSDKEKEKIGNADSQEKIEEVKGEMIESKLSELKNKNDNSTILSVGLGVLAIAALLILGWVLMKQNSSLPQIEPKKDKDKEK